MTQVASPLFISTSVSERYLSFAEREEIALLRAQDIGIRETAGRLGRSPDEFGVPQDN